MLIFDFLNVQFNITYNSFKIYIHVLNRLGAILKFNSESFKSIYHDFHRSKLSQNKRHKKIKGITDDASAEVLRVERLKISRKTNENIPCL